MEKEKYADFKFEAESMLSITYLSSIESRNKRNVSRIFDRLSCFHSFVPLSRIEGYRLNGD